MDYFYRIRSVSTPFQRFLSIDVSSQSDISENPLRRLKVACVNEIDFNAFDTITNKTIDGYDEYLVKSMELNPIDVTKKK